MVTIEELVDIYFKYFDTENNVYLEEFKRKAVSSYGEDGILICNIIVSAVGLNNNVKKEDILETFVIILGSGYEA